MTDEETEALLELINAGVPVSDIFDRTFLTV